PPQKDEKTQQHADASGAKTVMPSNALSEVPADERRDERAGVDPHVEDREPRVTPLITAAVDLADHRRDVRLEEAGADDDEPESEIECRHRLHREGEVPRRDDKRTDHQRAPRAEPPVGEIAAKERREPNEPGVRAIQ